VPLHVRCPHCGATYRVADEQAGGTATCPECDAPARIPTPDATAGESRPPSGPRLDPSYGPPHHAGGFDPPQVQPAYGPWDPAAWRAEAERRVGFHLTIIGVLDIVLSVLCLLWGMICFAVSHAIRTEAIPLPPELQDPAVRNLAIVVYPVVGVLSLVTFFFLLVGGITLIGRRPSGRVLGLIAGGLCCASLWQCVLFPFCLILGIYSLVVLLGRDARLVFGDRRELAQPGSLPSGAGPVDSPR